MTDCYGSAFILIQHIREYKHFIFNSAGARFERAVKAGVGSADWNVPWKVAAVKTARGFDAEVFIPYYAVAPFSGAKTWRFNIARENGGGKTANFRIPKTSEC